jgi:hypothetical protein
MDTITEESTGGKNDNFVVFFWFLLFVAHFIC